MQAVWGGLGFPPRRGVKPGGSQSQCGRGASLEQGGEGQQQEAEEVSASSQASSGGWGQGLLRPWGGGYITMGGLLPDSFKQKAIACWGERSSRQRGGRGADLLGPQAHLRDGGRP